MARQDGRLVTLAVGNGGTPEVFTTLGGLVVSRLVLRRREIPASHLGDEGWRTLLSTLGERQLRVNGRGEFTDSAGEATLHALAFSGQIANWRMDFVTGGRVDVPCIVIAYEREADARDHVTYRLELESAGAGAYTPV